MSLLCGSSRDDSINEVRVWVLNKNCYFMRNPNRGKCVIFNNINFDKPTKLPTLKNGYIDGPKLANTFERLRFEIRYHTDLTCDQIKIAIDKLALQNFEYDDCLVICILTHGDEAGGLYGKDGRRYDPEYLFQTFNSANCPSLTHKPKIFLIDAESGNEFQNGIKFVVEDVATEKSSELSVPNWSDCLIAFSTTFGDCCFRGRDKGSLYIHYLYKCVKDNSLNEELDLVSILTMVNKLVAMKDIKKKFYLRETQKQMSEIVSSLTGRVCFTPCVKYKRMNPKLQQVKDNVPAFKLFRNQSPEVVFDFHPFSN